MVRAHEIRVRLASLRQRPDGLIGTKGLTHFGQIWRDDNLVDLTSRSATIRVTLNTDLYDSSLMKKAAGEYRMLVSTGLQIVQVGWIDPEGDRVNSSFGWVNCNFAYDKVCCA